jgi:hypothetical protein
MGLVAGRESKEGGKYLEVEHYQALVDFVLDRRTREKRCPCVNRSGAGSVLSPFALFCFV